jgi:hypothetical protein
VDSGGTARGLQQQQGSPSRAFIVGRYFISIPSLNKGNLSNLSNL